MKSRSTHRTITTPNQPGQSRGNEMKATVSQSQPQKARGEYEVMSEGHSLGVARLVSTRNRNRNAVAAYAQTKQGQVRLGEFPNVEEAVCKIGEFCGATVDL